MKDIYALELEDGDRHEVEEKRKRKLLTVSAPCVAFSSPGKRAHKHPLARPI
ncbi:hypothetical protein M422DRAFT_38517 [Sphaerobolus stellatus SS14]|uniref:Uncharacterized protein n=1 Tax=Sphaerobolus stellatus (strain SS14) TaxID=990650 RepID=A0A0C9T9I3_SPHS4|nr:hypothetical protein M422DRAFT_38517 [Sphaerobolus stellatus SS14]